jgi:hypothetical protein
MSDDLIASLYFYTYSTIAQTLAGAFGFFVAVVLYLIQGFHTQITNCAAALVAGSPANQQRMRQLHLAGKWDEMIELHADAKQVNPQLDDAANLAMDEHFQEMRRQLVRERRVRRELSRSMGLTATVILVSIIFMPFTAFFFEPRDPGAVILLSVTIFGAMFCIRGYMRLMENVFSS